MFFPGLFYHLLGLVDLWMLRHVGAFTGLLAAEIEFELGLNYKFVHANSTDQCWPIAL